MMKTMAKQGGSRGFTIIEVMVVLAITGFLLVAASTVLKGQSGDTAFQQATRDIQSKIENTVNEVENGLLPNTDTFVCHTSANTGYPLLTQSNTGGNSGANQDCVYLGKAIKVTANSSQMKIYAVVANRLYDNGTGKVTPATLAQAKPAPILLPQLIETYTPLSNGATLKSATYNSGTTQTAEMAGFYLDPAGSSLSQDKVDARAYSANGSVADQAISDCIGESVSGCTRADISDWTLCYLSGDGQKTARIDVLSSGQAVTTRLRYVSC